MPRFVVTGARGQLGADLVRILGAAEVTALDHAALDVGDEPAVRTALRELRPEVVVNAAAYNHVDLAETTGRTDAFRVNADGPRHLARTCRNLGALLVHVSTDYVFDGRKRTPYRTDDEPRPRGAYAESKRLGESRVAEDASRWMIVRTSGLYGLRGKGGKGGNFVETMLRLAASGREIRVVDDQTLAPSFSEDVARRIVDLALRWLETRSDLLGIHHVVNAGATTWHGFARRIFELARLEPALRAITTEEYGAPAPRPSYSVLDTSRFEALGMEPLRSWDEALADYLGRRRAT